MRDIPPRARGFPLIGVHPAGAGPCGPNTGQKLLPGRRGDKRGPLAWDFSGRIEQADEPARIVRREEIEGFIDGLFGKEEKIDLPERAHRALNALSEMRALLEGTRVLADDPTKPAAADDIVGTIRDVHELTKIAEHEMHEAVLACKRARRQLLRTMAATKPVLH